MKLIRTAALLLLLAAPAQLAPTSVAVRHMDVVIVHGENDPLDAPLTADLGARPDL